MLESARGRISARPSGVLEMVRWDPGALYLAGSIGDIRCEDEAPLGVVGVYAW